MRISKTYDVIIVGTGITGLAAAVTCAELGMSAGLLEKMPAVGGTTAMSGGWFAFSETEEQSERQIRDSDAQFVTDMDQAADHSADRTLLEALARDQHESYHWMKALGITFDVVKLSAGQKVPRSHHASISDVMANLIAKVEAAPEVDLLLSHVVKDLLTDDSGVVSGVAAAGPDGELRLASRRGVLLATGGFSRSASLISSYAPEQAEAMPYGGLGNTGDGLVMAQRLGAGVRDMEFLSGTYGSHPDTGIAEHELLTAFYMGAIIVNTAGHRFTDESLSYKTLGAACLKQPGGLAFQVFDRVVRAKSQRGVPLSDIDHLEEKGRLFKADSIADLAVAAGLDPSELTRTIDTYNASVSRGADAFGRSGLCNGVGELIPVMEPPFYAYPAKTLMTSTYCGLTVSANAAVLDRDEEPIPHLFAAGEVVGGFHGKAYVTGTALSKGLIYGRVAIKTIATAH